MENITIIIDDLSRSYTLLRNAIKEHLSDYVDCHKNEELRLFLFNNLHGVIFSRHVFDFLHFKACGVESLHTYTAFTFECNSKKEALGVLDMLNQETFISHLSNIFEIELSARETYDKFINVHMFPIKTIN